VKRDKDFIRELLFEVESLERYLFLDIDLKSSEHLEEKTLYHLELMCDEGLLMRLSVNGLRMSSHGHDFIDAIRDDTIWKRTKEGAKTVGGVTLGMLADLAKAYVKEEIKSKLGVSL
jgi:hypothetical protein